MRLKNIGDQELVQNIKNLVGKERRVLADLLCHLREIDSRRLYLGYGFPSLFAFCVEFLGYGEAAAQRRIVAARALRELPELESKIEDGSLTLTAISQAQSFFKHASFDIEEKREVLKWLENKTTRQVEKELVQLNPNFSPKKETVKLLTETKAEVKIVLDQTTLEKLEQLKGLFAHRLGSDVSLANLIDLLASDALKKRNLKKPLILLSAPKVKGRYVPQSLKNQIWSRDLGQCNFQDPLTGKVCGSKFKLQIDHVIPFAQGGATTLENLRLRCSGHNTWHAMESFGRAKMQKFQLRN